MTDVTLQFTKTCCSYCGSEYVTAVQYDENFEKFKAASANAWVGLTRDEILEAKWHNKSNYKFARVLEDILKRKNT